MIRAFWFNTQNFGDMLNPWLINKISGEEVCYVQDSDAEGMKVMVVGSILAHAKRDCVVWGCGLGDMAEDVKKEADIRMVRGPLSARKCPRPVQAMGDPALLVPGLYTPRSIKNIYTTGCIPHYVDQVAFFKLFGSRVKFINVHDPIEKVVDDVWSCSRILSSSLHGLIIADALHKPTRWVKFTDKLSGDGTKFLDYQVHTSGRTQTCLNLADMTIEDPESFAKAECEDRQIKFSPREMMAACPFPVKVKPQFR